jgi:hypothetical protein
MANGKPGAPKGNKNNAKGKLWSDALRLELAGNVNAKKLRKIAQKVIEMATEGDMQAIREIGDRLEGKPSQSIDMTVTEMSHEEALDLLDQDIDESASHTTH